MEFPIDKAGARKTFFTVCRFPGAGKFVIADTTNMKNGVRPVPLRGDDQSVFAVARHDGVGVDFFGCLRVYEKDRKRPGFATLLVRLLFTLVFGRHNSVFP